jgi:hypothetical protein
MKLPKLVKTVRQLRKILRHDATTIQATWSRIGPCPEFICSPAVELSYKGESYIVFTTVNELETFHADLKRKDAENTGA